MKFICANLCELLWWIHLFDGQKRAYFKKIEKMNLRNPRMVGFGISNEATFRAACENASGAIIGSRFVTLLHEEKNPEKAITR